MAEMIPFNMNQTVKVKLRGEGMDIMREINKELSERLKSVGVVQGLSDYEPNLDDQGYVNFQLWTFMEIFGKHIGFGKEQPFELDVIFVKD